MARKLRYLPSESLVDYLPSESLVEVTCRTIQRRFLLRPSIQLNEIIVGTLARAQERYGMKVCAFVYLSNHCHLLLRPADAKQLADFMRYVNSKIAREVGRLHDWKEKVWGRRYTDIVVSHEPEAQIARLRYLLEQGCKERLVASPTQWPGATSTKALMHGSGLEGIWIDRTEQFKAFERRAPNSDALFTSRHRLKLTPIPCWDNTDDARWQAIVRRMVREIESDAAAHDVLGRSAILSQRPRDHPRTEPMRSPAPRFHAINPGVRRAPEWTYHLVRVAYRQASQDVRLGRLAEFPAGCFPPPNAFVSLRS